MSSPQNRQETLLHKLISTYKEQYISFLLCQYILIEYCLSRSHIVRNYLYVKELSTKGKRRLSSEI